MPPSSSSVGSLDGCAPWISQRLPAPPADVMSVPPALACRRQTARLCPFQPMRMCLRWVIATPRLLCLSFRAPAFLCGARLPHNPWRGEEERGPWLPRAPRFGSRNSAPAVRMAQSTSKPTHAHGTAQCRRTTTHARAWHSSLPAHYNPCTHMAQLIAGALQPMHAHGTAQCRRTTTHAHAWHSSMPAHYNPCTRMAQLNAGALQPTHAHGTAQCQRTVPPSKWAARACRMRRVRRT